MAIGATKAFTGDSQATAVSLDRANVAWGDHGPMVLRRRLDARSNATEEMGEDMMKGSMIRLLNNDVEVHVTGRAFCSCAHGTMKFLLLQPIWLIVTLPRRSSLSTYLK